MSLPVYQSGLSHIETRVYVTDRENQRRDLIDNAEITVDADWDIDRAGSKGQVNIEASAGVLTPGMWIAPYQVIIPETGDIVEQQKGHFRLGLPGSRFDDMMDFDGNYRHQMEAFGGDIVDDIAAVRLPFTIYTPRNGHVMSDVQMLIKMATAGILGDNMVSNHSFEDSGTDWTTSWYNGASGVLSWTVPAGWDTPDGSRVVRFSFDASSPVDGGAYATSNSVPIPSGTDYLWTHGHSYSSGGMSMFMQIRFYDADGNPLPSNTTIQTRPLLATTNSFVTNAWSRQFGVGDVPAGAVTYRVWLWSIDRIGSRSVSAAWDDIQVRTCTNKPISDGRINLPHSTATATTRIQTTGGGSIAYDAINADRLAAIGHTALYAEYDGRLTSRPSQSASNATPARTYRRTDIRDYRIIGEVERPSQDGNVPNHFIAVKESFEDDVETMFANSYNTNPNDPFSTVNTGRVISANAIMSQDAVSQAALQTVADAARDRQSLQEELMITVLPDPDLMAHDVVEIIDPAMPGVSGKWMVQYIRPGMRPENPLTELGLRRAYTGGL